MIVLVVAALTLLIMSTVREKAKRVPANDKHRAFYEAMEKGHFRSPSPETILKETKLLLEGLQVTSQFLSDHISNLLPLHGKLPEEKRRLIEMIEDGLKQFREDAELKKEMELRRHLTNL